MKHEHKRLVGAVIALALIPVYAGAEILAMVNYESKSPDSLKVLKNPVAPQARKEGIAIIDVDPASKDFGKMVQDMPLPADQVAHHIFYNRDQVPPDFAAPNAGVVCQHATELADRIGSDKVANVIMLGALLEKTECLSSDTAMAVLRAKVKNTALLEMDATALAAGRDFVDSKVNIGPVSQPDGFAD